MATFKVVTFFVISTVLVFAFIAREAEAGSISSGAMGENKQCGRFNKGPPCQKVPANPYNRGCNKANKCRGSGPTEFIEEANEDDKHVHISTDDNKHDESDGKDAKSKKDDDKENRKEKDEKKISTNKNEKENKDNDHNRKENGVEQGEKKGEMKGSNPMPKKDDE
ncbi:unnamed protein product [Linum trigynum]|uniref:Uncharacterized protein n=1 Tax=Linum trigynum TaxID=586398 RepID=A0AAV2E815_9ROSI